ncbi:MAG: hypothetical protein ACRD0K_17410 [Egibacteraceae bacterium]
MATANGCRVPRPAEELTGRIEAVRAQAVSATARRRSPGDRRPEL